MSTSRNEEPDLAAVAQEVLEELRAALVAVDAAHVEEERNEEAMTPSEALGVHAGRQLRAHPHHLAGQGPARRPLQHGPLLGAVEDEGRRLGKKRGEDRETVGAIVLGGGHEEGRPARGPQPVDGRPVSVAEEDEGVVAVLPLRQRLHHPRAVGTLLVEPGERLGFGRAAHGRGIGPAWLHAGDLSQNACGRLRVAGVVARTVDGETPHPHPADVVLPFRVVVGPGDVVAGTGREHLHLGVPAQALGDEPAVVLGPSRDLEPVALDHEAQAPGHSLLGFSAGASSR